MSATIFDPKVVQDQLRDALLADPAFATIPVISADPGDITTAIEDAINRLGIGVLILTPSLSVSPSVRNLPGPYFDKIRIIAEIAELTTFNRAEGDAYTTATTAAMLAAALLDGFAPVGVNERVYVTDVVPVPDPTKTYNIWHIEMTGKAGVKYTLPQIAPVTVSSTSPGPVILRCATPGAPIWFTTDGSYPSPRNPTSQLYLPYAVVLGSDDAGNPIVSGDGGVLVGGDAPAVVPLTIEEGTQLKARAWLAGYASAKPDFTTVQY